MMRLTHDPARQAVVAAVFAEEVVHAVGLLQRLECRDLVLGHGWRWGVVAPGDGMRCRDFPGQG